MDLYALAFYFFAVLIVGSAAVVVFSRNIMYSAFSLLFTFFGVAGFYVLLNADFIAVTQIMIYIGGILVLIIFGVMLTTRVVDVKIKTGTIGKIQYRFMLVLSLIVAVLLSVFYLNVNWLKSPAALPDATIEPIGTLLMLDYLIAFEVAAVLLLVAFIGAALIARRK